MPAHLRRKRSVKKAVEKPKAEEPITPKVEKTPVSTPKVEKKPVPTPKVEKKPVSTPKTKSSPRKKRSTS